MPEIRVSPNDAKAQKGQKIYSGEYKGQRLRVSVPSSVTKEEDIRPFFEKEFQRREASKKVVQPVSGSGYPAIDYGATVIAGLPGAAGRLLSGTGRDPFGEDILGVKNPEGIPDVHQPMTVDQMPIMKALHGDLPPEEGSDLALNMLLMAAGGRFGENQGPTRFRTGLARAGQSTGRSRVGGVLGGVGGAAAGYETAKGLGIPGYYGAAAGYKLGDLAGSRLPSALSAFKRGYSEPISRPAGPAAPPPRTPTASYYGMPQGLPRPAAGPYQQPPMQAQGIPYGVPRGVGAGAPQAPTAPIALPPATTPQLPSGTAPIELPPVATKELGPGFSERLQNLKAQTEAETPGAPKEAPKSVSLPEVKKFAKASNSSVEEAVKQFEDSGVKVTRGPKIRMRRRK